MQYQTARLLVSLVILLVTRSPANSFTIRKTEKLKVAPDLDTGESSLLEVKSDLPVVRDENLFHNNNTKQEINNIVIGLSDATRISKYNEIIDKNVGIQVKPSESKPFQGTGVISNINDTTNWKSNSKTNSSNIPIINSILNEDNLTSKAMSPQSSVSGNLILTTNKSSYDTITSQTTADFQLNQPINQTSTIGADFVTSYINTITDSYSNEITLRDRRDMTSSATDFRDEDKYYKGQTMSQNTTDDDNIINSSLIEHEFQSTLQAHNNSSKILVPTTIISTLNTVTTELSSEPNSSTESTFEMVKAKSKSNSHTLEETLINTSSSNLLEDSKSSNLNNSNYSTKSFDTSSFTNVKSIKQQNPTTDQTKINNNEKKIVKLEIFSSKRAGYLDNSETKTSKQEKATTEKYVYDKFTNKTNNFGAMYESEVSDDNTDEGIEYNNTNVRESQGQLADDAMKEELLMEKTLNENEIIKLRQPTVTLDNTSSAMTDISTTTELVNDNIFSVKSISGDQRKNTTLLYAVSPNYKPLKKLDVQPSKPFIRDPDDNSWRNESISSLGIVFKPKNASKSFTEVLKNKTTELSNSVGKYDNSEMLDLRLRLEKITEVRKSKKKRINNLGDTVYNDYEESSENTKINKADITSPMVPSQEMTPFTTSSPLTSSTKPDHMLNDISKDTFEIFKNDVTTPLTTIETKKPYSLSEYYDAGDDYDSDYVTLPKIDIKKFTVPFKSKDTLTTQHSETYTTRPLDWRSPMPTTITYQPDRQPTVQYFPPTKKVTLPVVQNINQKVNVNEYDDDFKNKVNLYAYNEVPKVTYKVSSSTESSLSTKKIEELSKLTIKSHENVLYPNDNMNKNLYLTSQSSVTESPVSPNDGNFNRAFYVIKHYKDFINDAAKDIDDEKVNLQFRSPPIQGVTMGDIMKLNAQEESKPIEDYDYETQFRKEIVNRFVDNFNDNSDRFKVDFPIIYNNSVVHTKTYENGKVVASSSAFMKRMYETRATKPNIKACDFNCERMTVELSPAYELHYYVPDQEEKEIMQRSNTGPYHFTL